MDLKEQEIDFLIEEYKTAWQMILNIDERRGKFIQYYSFVFIGVIGLVVNLLKDVNLLKTPDSLLLSKKIAASVLLLVTAIAGGAIIWILRAERKSNVRYRKKVNLIRGILLAKSYNADIKEYLKHKEDMGIKIAEDNEKIEPIGSTLTGIFLFIGVEIVILLGGAIFLCYKQLMYLCSGLLNYIGFNCII